jgi:hypothetical protein
MTRYKKWISSDPDYSFEKTVPEMKFMKRVLAKHDPGF